MAGWLVAQGHREKVEGDRHLTGDAVLACCAREMARASDLGQSCRNSLTIIHLANVTTNGYNNNLRRPACKLEHQVWFKVLLVISNVECMSTAEVK